MEVHRRLQRHPPRLASTEPLQTAVSAGAQAQPIGLCGTDDAVDRTLVRSGRLEEHGTSQLVQAAQSAQTEAAFVPTEISPGGIQINLNLVMEEALGGVRDSDQGRAALFFWGVL